MNIQWFPGHMAKARRLLTEQLKLVDVVVELGDARIPISSRNPLLQELLGSKPKLLLLNKVDLADRDWTEKWLNELRKISAAIAVSAATGNGINRIVPQLEKLAAAKIQQASQKGIRSRAVRAMVVGIPNIGKSTLINQLTGGSQAKTGDKPGVTRGNQWIRIHEKVELLDTPGLLWPKFEDPEIGRRLAATGAVKDEVFDIEELAQWLFSWLKEKYPKIPVCQENEDPENILVDFGRRRGCLVKGGHIDTLKAAQIFLREFRHGKLGSFTLDWF